MHNRKRIQGFTLLEILIALAVFAIMSLMAYAGLGSILDANESTKPRATQIAQLQNLWFVFNEDLRQIIDRPIRDELGGVEPAFSIGRGNDLLVFTRRVPAWSYYSANNAIQRISYRYENGALYRYAWALLDRTQKSEYRRRKLINAQYINLKVFDVASKAWLPFTGKLGGIPEAVDISIGLDGLGDIRRSFLINQ